MANRPVRSGSSGLLPICLALQLLLMGRGTGLFGEGDERLDDISAVPAWFERHRGKLEVVMRLLLPHESIHRVWRAEPSSSQQYGKLSPEDGAAYAGAFAIKERLGIPNVIVWRLDDKNPSFTFVLWRIGMVGSGRSTTIHYDEEKETFFHRYNNAPDKAMDLGLPYWFAVRSSSD